MKQQYIQSNETKEALLNSLGIEPLQDPKLVSGTRFGDFDIEETKLFIREKLRGIKEQKSNSQQSKLRPFALFRGICRVILALIFLKNYAKRNIEKIKEEQQKICQYDISINLEITRAWLLQSIRIIIVSLIQDDFPFDIINLSLSHTELNLHILRLQVRIKG